jgi:hypothetical protein
MPSGLADIAQALRDRGYEARNLGQIGTTVWKNGRASRSKIFALPAPTSFIGRRLKIAGRHSRGCLAGGPVTGATW